MPTKPRTFDEYLAAVSDEQRAALRSSVERSTRQHRGRRIHRLWPGRLSIEWQAVGGSCAAAKHCAFYPMSGSTVAAHQDILQKYETSKGSIRFPASKPVPAALVRKLVRARIAENEA